jgi:hypothetical protein
MEVCWTPLATIIPGTTSPRLKPWLITIRLGRVYRLRSAVNSLYSEWPVGKELFEEYIFSMEEKPLDLFLVAVEQQHNITNDFNQA